MSSPRTLRRPAGALQCSLHLSERLVDVKRISLGVPCLFLASGLIGCSGGGDGIGTVYQSIQTGIVFQYVARLGDADLSQGTVLGLSFDHDGLRVERSLTLVR